MAADLKPSEAHPPATTQSREDDSIPSSPSSSKPDSVTYPDQEGAATPSPVDGETANGRSPQKPDLNRTTSRASEFSSTRIAIIIFSLCVALFLAALDVTIITTALPTIAQRFHANSADYTWVGSAYLLANAASVPLWGKLSDIWGRKPIILLANVVFMVGSLVAAVANSIGLLIGGRVIQGIGGGGLVTLVYICVGDLFSLRERPKYYAILSVVWAIASGLGPIVGGAFTEKVSWRWNFYINLPLDGVSLILLTFFLKLDTPKTPFVAGIKAIDWIGVITIVGGVVMFLFGMTSGGVTHPWDSAYVLCLIIFGIFMIVLFFLNEWKLAKYPIIPLRLFSTRSNVASLSVCFIHGFVFIAGSYYLPFYFQTVLAATPILSGVYLLTMVIALSLVAIATGIYIKKTGRFRDPIWFGLVTMTLGYGLFIDLPNHDVWSKIIIYQIIAGIGVGPNFQSPLIALQAHIKGHDMAVATATFGFVRNLSTSISVALGSVVFTNELKKKYSALEPVVGAEQARLLTSASFGATTRIVRTLPEHVRRIVDIQYTDALRTMWIFYTAFAAFGILLSLFITKTELSRVHEKARTGIEEQEKIRKEVAAEREARRSRKSTLQGGDIEKGMLNQEGSPTEPAGSPTTGSPVRSD
jgi:EmrB/QacA subfamily drug resistance transporter